MDAVTRVLLVWRLLLSNSSVLVRIALYVVPVAMLLTIWVSLTLDGLVQVYIKRLELAYAGMQGRLSIEAQPFTINQFKTALTENGYQALPRHEQTHLIQLKLKNNQDIRKFISLVVFEDEAYEKRFKIDDQSTLIINQVLAEQLGELVNDVSAIKYYKKNNWLSYNKAKIIDTGFLTTKAILFISKKQYENTMGQLLKGFTSLEIINNDNADVTGIKEKIDKIARTSSAGSYKINDILLDTADARQQFASLRMTQLSLLIIVLSIAAITITYAVKLLLVLKMKALSIMNRLGLARYDLSLALISGVTIAFLMMMVAGFALHNLTFVSVLELLDMPVMASVMADSVFYFLFFMLLVVIAFVAGKSAKDAVLTSP